MKLRAFLLIAILIGGSFTMMLSFHDYDEKQFSEIFSTMNSASTTLLFTKPAATGNSIETWHVDDHSEIDSLLDFLQDYHVRKLKPEEININDKTEQFSIQLHDEDGNTLSILVTENLIIQNSSLYYEIVDGPLDVEWLVHFFISNRI